MKMGAGDSTGFSPGTRFVTYSVNVMKKGKLTEAMKKEAAETIEIMQSVMEDRSVPRNIRAVVEQAITKVGELQEDGMNFSQAIYLLDDVSNDVNMPGHTRTDIWEVISRLEALKEKTK